MSEVFMENYLGKNIYKVSNPPGGQSSISLSWNHPPDQLSQRKFPISQTLHQQPHQQNSNINQKKSLIYQHHNSKNYSHPHNNSMIHGDSKRPISYDKLYEEKNQYGHPENRSFVSKMQANSFRDNLSFVEGVDSHRVKRGPMGKEYQGNKNSELTDNNTYGHPILGKNLSSPFSYSKKGYAQYMSPNFIEPRKNEFPAHESSIHNWESSSRLLEEELKYYQEKNKLLKEKVYGGFRNEEALRKYEPDYRDFYGRMNMVNQPEELQLAIRSRQKNMAYDNQEFRNKQQGYHKVYLENFNSLLNGNGSMISGNGSMMENQSGVKTSVKVHGPPGGYSSIKLG